jgi:predicted transcriptional regulator
MSDDGARGDLNTVKVVVGTTLREQLRGVADAWKRAERGEPGVRHHVVAFESWDALREVLTAERLRLLRHLRAHPARSVRALAVALRRDYRNVHGDVAALLRAGLVERSREGIRATADMLAVEVPLTEGAAV